MRILLTISLALPTLFLTRTLSARVAEPLESGALPCADELARATTERRSVLKGLRKEAAALLPIAEEMLDDVVAEIVAARRYPQQRGRKDAHLDAEKMKRAVLAAANNARQEGRATEEEEEDDDDDDDDNDTADDEEGDDSDEEKDNDADSTSGDSTSGDHANGDDNGDNGGAKKKKKKNPYTSCVMQKAVECGTSLRFAANLLHHVVTQCRGRARKDLGISAGAVKTLADAATALADSIALQACPRMPAANEVSQLELQEWWAPAPFSRSEAPPFVRGARCPWL